MRRGQHWRVCFGLCLCLGVPASAPAAEALLPAAEVRRLLEAAEEPGNVSRAIGLLEAIPKHATTADLLALLAEAHYQRGHRTEDRDQAVQTFERAIAHADRALALAPGHVPARYWRAVSMLGMAGRLRGAESFGLVRRAVSELDAVAAADPALDTAGAHRALGKVYLESPMWFLGDTEKAIEHLEKARALVPHSLQNRRFLAEAYAEDGREADALRELEGILNTPPRPGREASEQKERDLARRMADRVRARLKKP